MSPRPKLNPEDEVPFYWVQIIDAELGKIRFGPFTEEEFLKSPVGALGQKKTATPAVMAQDIRKQVNTLGLVSALTSLGIWGGLVIKLRGDDGTDIEITEVEAP